MSVSGLLSIGLLGTLNGNGGVVGNVSNGGVVAPGNSPGALTITGNYSQTSNGKLQIELGGITPGSAYDQLLVNGNVSLNGTLDVALVNSFMPSVGNAFDILDWGTLGGTFSTLQLPSLTGGLTWNTSRLYTDGILSIGLPGDFNATGTVDAADYVVWRKENGAPAEYDTWRANFGNTTGSGAGAGANISVPEPATLVMLITIIPATRSRRRAMVL